MSAGIYLQTTKRCPLADRPITLARVCRRIDTFYMTEIVDMARSTSRRIATDLGYESLPRRPARDAARNDLGIPVTGVTTPNILNAQEEDKKQAYG